MRYKIDYTVNKTEYRSCIIEAADAEEASDLFYEDWDNREYDECDDSDGDGEQIDQVYPEDKQPARYARTRAKLAEQNGQLNPVTGYVGGEILLQQTLSVRVNNECSCSKCIERRETEGVG